jgi:hypothetical protein
MGCKKMGAVTHPHPDVIAFVEQNFIPVKIDVTARDPEAIERLRQWRLMWAPGFVVADPKGIEARRWLGYQAPREHIADLTMALAKIHFAWRRFDEAYDAFRAVADLDPPAPVTPEAVYWSAIAAYRRDNADLEFLRRAWEELRLRFPNDRWWTHADVY